MSEELQRIPWDGKLTDNMILMVDDADGDEDDGDDVDWVDADWEDADEGA